MIKLSKQTEEKVVEHFSPKPCKKVVPLLTIESRLKRKIRSHLKKLGYKKNSKGELVASDLSKNGIRLLHAQQRQQKLLDSKNFVEKKLSKFLCYFASGYEIEPTRIEPRIEIVTSDTWQSDLFRLASLTWSIPVSYGYGRRMRFLVWDDYNDKIIGIIALGDPVFNLKARDLLIGWDQEDRRKRLVNIMDAFVLGALPPYNYLLAGKLVASLVRTKEIKDAFKNRYNGAVGVISKENKNASLVACTTSSALGRSSIYNRLKLQGKYSFKSIGFTSGWGHFHIPNDLFEELREYLASVNHPYVANHKFGDGPNWRLRTVRAALGRLGMDGDILKHGINREVFLCELATNAIQILNGQEKEPRYDDLLSVTEVSELAKERWLIPRAHRNLEYANWTKLQIINLLDPNKMLYQESNNLPLRLETNIYRG